MYIIRFIKYGVIIDEIGMPRIKTEARALELAIELRTDNEEIEIIKL